MVLPNPIPRYLPHLLVVALLMAVPSAAAHNVTPVESKTGDITLGPSGNSSAIYHQFGFVLAIGESLSISQNVSQGSQDAINFQIHDHVTNFTKVFLNGTQSTSRPCST